MLLSYQVSKYETGVQLLTKCLAKSLNVLQDCFVCSTADLRLKNNVLLSSGLEPELPGFAPASGSNPGESRTYFTNLQFGVEPNYNYNYGNDPV